jgi:hypothetical protein
MGNEWDSGAWEKDLDRSLRVINAWRLLKPLEKRMVAHGCNPSSGRKLGVGSDGVA